MENLAQQLFFVGCQCTRFDKINSDVNRIAAWFHQLTIDKIYDSKLQLIFNHDQTHLVLLIFERDNKVFNNSK